MKNLILFESGSLILQEPSPEVLHLKSMKTLLWDERTKEWRCLAYEYRNLIEEIQNLGQVFEDKAKDYPKISLSLKSDIIPREHQSKGLLAWLKNAEGRGIVCFPTGGGKTILGMMAIAKLSRPTMVIVPTIDLMHQWYEVMNRFFDSEYIGLLGGGYHEIKHLTISTYDSGAIHCERLGNRFGFLIFDECHHLPGDTYRKIALASIAPFRLGLTATLERQDGKEELLFDYIGPKVFEARITDLVGQDLAPYEIITWDIALTEEEAKDYKRLRLIYTQFIQQHKIRFGSSQGWQTFLSACYRHPGGKAAFKAYREQKKIPQSGVLKLEALWQVLQRHSGARILVFTEDNAFAYRIGECYFLPVLTHKTGVKERKAMLEAFRSGKLNVLVTSKVLNEGVDVPEASVAVIVSGNGTVREHVQRLGRILRSAQGKRAILYEFVTKDTGEMYVSQRRRDHEAYQS